VQHLQVQDKSRNQAASCDYCTSYRAVEVVGGVLAVDWDDAHTSPRNTELAKGEEPAGAVAEERLESQVGSVEELPARKGAVVGAAPSFELLDPGRESTKGAGSRRSVSEVM
jgi:hypothetical protein